MRRHAAVVLLALATAAIVLVPAPVLGEDLLDQRHQSCYGGGSSTASGGHYFDQVAAVAQTFVPTADSLSAVGAKFNAYDRPGYVLDVVMRIYEGSPPLLGSEIGAKSQQLIPSQMGTWNVFEFATPISLNPGATYSIVVEPLGNVLAAWSLLTCFGSPNYLNGQPWIETFGGSWAVRSDVGDFMFRTYYPPPNLPPVADADGPYAVPWGDDLVLDGLGSTDPDDDPLTYEWSIAGTITAGPTTDAVSVVPWSELEALLIDCGNNCIPVFTVELTVTDPGGLTDTAPSDLIVQLLGPVADARGPYEVEFGTGNVVLDPNDSYDPKFPPYGPTDPFLLPWQVLEWRVNEVPFPFGYDPLGLAILELDWPELVGLGIDTLGEAYRVGLLIVDFFGLENVDFTELTVVDTTPPECEAALVPIQVTETQGEFMVTYECSDLADPEVDIVANINGVPVTDGHYVELNDSDPGITLLELLAWMANGIPWDMAVHALWGEWIITAPAFALTVTAADDSGNETTVMIEPVFANTTPAVGPPDAPVLPPNTPPPGVPPNTEWPPSFPPVTSTTTVAAPEDCSVELTKLYGYWNQGTFRIDASCEIDVTAMALDLNGHEVTNGQMVELVRTWGAERVSDMWGALRIEAPDFLLTLTTTAPDGTWTTAPDF